MKLVSANHKTNKKRRLLLEHAAKLWECLPQGLANGSCTNWSKTNPSEVI